MNQTPIIKGRRCRKTLRRCRDKDNDYCVNKVKRSRRSAKLRRCKKGTRRCSDGVCHKVNADTIPLVR